MCTLLIVDDEQEHLHAARTLLRGSLSDVQVRIASSASDALRLLAQHPVTLVVTDLHMPAINGLELLRTIREQPTGPPVIVMTAHGSEEAAARALNEGAAGYIVKQRLDQQLVPLVQKVLSAITARQDRQRLEKILQYTETRLVLNNESELALPIVGYLQEKASRLLPFDDGELINIGLAVDEALKNAIFHGNLEVSSELRELDNGAFHEIATRRRSQSPFADRRVHVICRVSHEAFICVIRDEGKGFDVQGVPDPLAPENLEKASGRGLLMIRRLMDEVTHNTTANEITMVKRPRMARNP